MTGITKLANTGIFSSFNNLEDVSLEPAYGTLLGYTEEEIRTYFSPYLDDAARVLACSSEHLIGELRRYYDGFCFDRTASTHVYCPWSVLSFFKKPGNGFLKYWYQSGGRPSLLMRYLTDHGLEQPVSFDRSGAVTDEELNSSQDVSNLTAAAILVQTGYLTIREANDMEYLVGYPNLEVSHSMARLYADELLGKVSRTALGLSGMPRALLHGDLAEAVSVCNRTLLALDYRDFPVANEASCRAVVQILLLGATLQPIVEVHSALGRSDLEVTAGAYHWVFEFKFAKVERDVEKKLEEGILQVKTRRYGETVCGKEVRRAVLVFSAKTRQIEAWCLVPTS